MPVAVTGLREFKKALKTFEPELRKSMDIEISAIAAPVVQKARNYISPSIPGLSAWAVKPTSEGRRKNKYFTDIKPFPRFDVGAAKRGIKFQKGNSRKNNKGFVSLYRIVNSSASGAIIETAGRRNTDGRAPVMSTTLKQAGGVSGTTYKRGKGVIRDQSHSYYSNNPFAGNHFVESMNKLSPLTAVSRGRKNTGRIIFRAWAESQGKVNAAIIKTLEKYSAQVEAKVGNGKVVKL